VEETPDAIADLARRHGFTQTEARVFDHLISLAESWEEIPDRSLAENIAFHTSHERIVGMLALRVVKRVYPEGWITRGEEEDRRLAEE
jgi:hypothetical protein